MASGGEAELAAVPAVAEVLRGRFPQDPTLPVGLVQVLHELVLLGSMNVNLHTFAACNHTFSMR